ncbi:hypothetical protein EPUS_08736 [Endocarpon pusillum Z07020]|uniref:Uncharacterized protein n=1 Tax=Endocarpon pusillum (strain Z07020 / HMAS-L-300199) TaxID=1263415 RepID=U1GL17_ENDPU|nr:uncharacterized protein EPUS_08736 [Endocarpon pusillum Z07020]ERF72908.1 hypothetical protein EPUS_08736 [Endocarpon pusillum Z07020]
MKFQVVLALVALVAAVPFEGGQLHKRAGEKIHVGYRAVHKAEAQAIEANGRKAVRSNERGGRQIGSGIYISPEFKYWTEAYSDPDAPPWDCAVFVDADYWNGLNKAWIPRSFKFPEDDANNPATCAPLQLWKMFPAVKRNRARFLQHLDPSFTIENTVRFSLVLNHEPKIQALIPQEIIDEQQFYLEPCAEDTAPDNYKIGELGKVDWKIEGLKGYGLGSDYE